MQGADENREPFRFAEDDDSDDLGGFSRGKRSYEDEEDEENGGWAINEDHSDRLWDSAEDIDDEEDEEVRTGDVDDIEEDDEEEADLFGGGAVRGRRGRPKGSTNANREKAAMAGTSSSESAFGSTGASLFDDQDTGPAAITTPPPVTSTAASAASTRATGTTTKRKGATTKASSPSRAAKSSAKK